MEEKNTLLTQLANKQRLRVPRRPPWTKTVSPAELDRKEKVAFLDWRQGLAEYVYLLHRSTTNPDYTKVTGSRQIPSYPI